MRFEHTLSIGTLDFHVSGGVFYSLIVNSPYVFMGNKAGKFEMAKKEDIISDAFPKSSSKTEGQGW